MVLKNFKCLSIIFILLTIELHGYANKRREGTQRFTRGLYINAYRAGDKVYMEKLTNDFSSLIKTLVIDIKDAHGKLTYKSNLKIVSKVNSQGTLIKDIKGYVKALKGKGFYLVGRIVVFRDPVFSLYKNKKFGVKKIGTKELWKDETGFVWVDPFSEEAYKYNIAIAEEAAQAGFDEIQFDYVRFPSPDGNSLPYFAFQKKRIKEKAILSFLSMANECLQRYSVRVSIAIFGYATWHNHLPREGQHLSETGKKVDVVYPMLYPSHFCDDFLADKHNETRTYNIIFKSIKHGDSLLRYTETEIIAYIQGFDWKKSKLGKDYIAVQMKAAEDAGSSGWIVWNAKGEYEEAYTSILANSIRIIEPDEKPRIREVSLTYTHNEEKSKGCNIRGIEAILLW